MQASIDFALEWEMCIRHSQLFIDRMLRSLRKESLSTVPDVSDRPTSALEPVIVDDYKELTEANRRAIIDSYHSRHGVAYLVVRNADQRCERHPLFVIADQLRTDLHLDHPLTHPLEGHSEAISRFGAPDGTVKIYNLPGKGGAAGYREQAETNEVFDFHHDGLGSGGTVETAILYMDSPPLWGGYTYFQNIPLLGLELAKRDREAFVSLFLPDALTIIRPRGKGAIKVRSPVLFVNENDKPQSFFRVASGEYQVHWRQPPPELGRARAFLERFAMPFASGSVFIHLSAKGHAAIMNNQMVAHARTAFGDDPQHGQVRVLSRKWFMRSERDSVYKHVPGMFVSKEFRDPYPQYFSQEFLGGEWLYDAHADKNICIRGESR